MRNTLSNEGSIIEDRFILIPEHNQPKMNFDKDEESNASDV
jgi:hypothetical protein